MTLKPSVLDEYRDIAETSAPTEPLTNFTSDDDVLGVSFNPIPGILRIGT